MNTPPRKWLISTDLDGSLLDENYQWKEAEPALRRIREQSIPLILNSSKTFAEMSALVKDLQLDAPVVCENGGVIAIPSESPLCQENEGIAHETFRLNYPSVSREHLLLVAHKIRKDYHFLFRGFSDLSHAEIMTLTGLSPEATHLATCRHASEPIIWDGSNRQRTDFEEHLKEHGMRLLKGGRFYHIIGPADKSDGFTLLAQRYQKAWPEIEWITVALGDSDNDLSMLSSANIAGVIPDRHGKRLKPTAPTVFHTQEPGPKGWNDIIQQLFNQQTAN